MGYSTVGKGLSHSEIWGWGIPSLDMEYSTAGYGVFHMGYAVNWVWH